MTDYDFDTIKIVPDPKTTLEATVRIDRDTAEALRSLLYSSQNDRAAFNRVANWFDNTLGPFLYCAGI